MRVLVVRVGAMGDVLHALPAVTALKRARPEWEIGWAVDERWAPLLPSATVAEVHRVPIRAWTAQPASLRTLRQIAMLRTELRRGRYDLCVDMQGTIRSAVIGRLAAAPKFVGYGDPREVPARWLYKQDVQRSGVHVVEQGCALLGGAVGFELEPVPIELPVDDAAEIWCDSLLAEVGRFVFLAPTAGWGAKMWPADRYGAVATELAAAGYRVLVNAASTDDAVAGEVVRSSRDTAAVVLSTVAGLISLLRRASLVIAADTGPLHMAAALRRPVVGLFGPTDPARNGPFGTLSRVLRHATSRTDHSRIREPEKGLLQIGVDDVMREAFALLQGEDM